MCRRTALRSTEAIRGARDSRAERAAARAADPQNLIWVMPAEERMQDVIVVVSRGSLSRCGLPSPCPTAATVIAADGGVDRAHALGLRDRRRDRGLRLGDAGRPRRRRSATGRGSSGTRPRRTRPTSSSRSMPRSRSRPRGCVVVGAARRPARSPAGGRCCCSATSATPRSRSTPSSAAPASTSSAASGR